MEIRNIEGRVEDYRPVFDPDKGNLIGYVNVKTGYPLNSIGDYYKIVKEKSRMSIIDKLNVKSGTEDNMSPATEISTVDSDTVSPSHYEGNIQPLDFMQAQMSKEEFAGFLKGNVIKYVARAGKKFGATEVEDLTKARRYLDWLIETAKGETINPRK